jgi:hypothetical protein
VEITGAQIAQIAAIGGTIAAGAFAIAKRLLDVVDRKLLPNDRPKDEPAASSRHCALSIADSEAWHTLREDARETRRLAGKIEESVGGGALACAWKDRDEVVELRGALTRSTVSIDLLNTNLAALTAEVRAGRISRAS